MLCSRSRIPGSGARHHQGWPTITSPSLVGENVQEETYCGVREPCSPSTQLIDGHVVGIHGLGLLWGRDDTGKQEALRCTPKHSSSLLRPCLSRPRVGNKAKS